MFARSVPPVFLVSGFCAHIGFALPHTRKGEAELLRDSMGSAGFYSVRTL
jgi:hypothetical protein